MAEWLVRPNRVRVGVDNMDAAVSLPSHAILQTSSQGTFLLEISTTADYGCLESLCLRAWDQPRGARRLLGTVQTAVSIGLTRRGSKKEWARGCTVQTPLLLFSHSAESDGCGPVDESPVKPGDLFGGMRRRTVIPTKSGGSFWIIYLTGSKVVKETDKALGILWGIT